MNEIDFVILWVDGNDPAWREEFVRTRQAENDDASEIRYRDWRNLHYWFRSAERFAPWVRKVHFITWGHLPAWLRRDHPKLHIVNHRDFIPAEYLPTFNSNTIELNIHRIEGLADRFVLFNDDTFLTRGCRPEDFFRRGVPCDMARLSVVQPSSVGHIIYNDLELIGAVGHSVAMANACEAVKKAARYETRSNDQGGVVWAIQHYLREGNLCSLRRV